MTVLRSAAIGIVFVLMSALAVPLRASSAAGPIPPLPGYSTEDNLCASCNFSTFWELSPSTGAMLSAVGNKFGPEALTLLVRLSGGKATVHVWSLPVRTVDVWPIGPRRFLVLSWFGHTGSYYADVHGLDLGDDSLRLVWKGVSTPNEFGYPADCSVVVRWNGHTYSLRGFTSGMFTLYASTNACLAAVPPATPTVAPPVSTSTGASSLCLVRVPEHDATVVIQGVDATSFCQSFETHSFVGVGELVPTSGTWNPATDTWQLTDGTVLRDQCVYQLTGQTPNPLLIGVYDDGGAVLGQQMCSNLSRMNGAVAQSTVRWQ